MNRNTRYIRSLLAKNKHDITVPRTYTQEGSTQLVSKNITIPYKTQPRKSQKDCPKVARAGCKQGNGPSIIEQCELFYGSYWLGKK